MEGEKMNERKQSIEEKRVEVMDGEKGWKHWGGKRKGRLEEVKNNVEKKDNMEKEGWI